MTLGQQSQLGTLLKAQAQDLESPGTTAEPVSDVQVLVLDGR
ncbi:hypothetical protein [Brachybacterium sp. EE-P12]|nr:hypothetical protein [Brachybacterium sp. EE-P12]